MREIKFRAWDIENKCMRNNVAVGLGMVEYDLSCHQPVEIMIPMQFTGLFDKNGTPIYEGDIVKYIAGKNYQTIGVVTWADDKNSFNLKTYPLMCAFVIHNEKENKTDKFEWDETDYMEVIGNIYENPTLLESDK